MLRIFISIPLLFLFLYKSASQTSHYTQNVVRVKFKPEATFLSGQNEVRSNGHLALGNQDFDEMNDRFQANRMKRVFPVAGKFEEKHKQYGLHLWYDIYTDNGNNVETLISAYGGLDVISVAEPVLIYNHNGIQPNAVSTNDPRLNEQWHYNNTGQSGGLAGADISLFEAWELEVGDPRVVVSVHDSGIDFNHPDLNDRLWRNTNEVPNDGIDNDNNGFIDDYHGYNFAAAVAGGDPSDLDDYNGHGTHTSGTIAAENNNGVGVSGVAGGSSSSNGVRIMMMKLGDEYGSPYIYNPAPSFVYAADMGAVISSNSWGGGSYDQALIDAIEYFVAEAGGSNSGLIGGLVVFSSGNSGSSYKDYKSDIANVMMVSATNHEDEKAWYSNYGDWVDISAPGGETDITNRGVLSTLPNNSYGFYQGTSMACPHVSGVASLVVSGAFGSGLSNSELFEILTESVDPLDDLNPSYEGLLGTGRINALKALQLGGTSGGRGGLIIDPVSINLEILQGNNRTYTVRVANTADYDIEVSIKNPNVQWMEVGAANLSIAANSVAKFQITLKSTSPGEFLESKLDFTYISFNSKVTTSLPVNMYTLGTPELNSPDTLAFPFTYKGAELTYTLQVQNSGTNYLEITGAKTNTSNFSIAFEPVTLAPAASHIYEVRFHPDQNGTLIDSINFTSNSVGGDKTVILKGLVNPNNPPKAQVVPDSIQLIFDYQTSGNIQFILTNIGGDPLTYTTLVNPGSDFDPSNTGGGKVKATSTDSLGISGIGDIRGYMDSPVGSERGMAWDGQNLWIKDGASEFIYKFNPESQIILDTITSIAYDTWGLDFYDGYLWELDNGDRIIKYSPNGSVINEIALIFSLNYRSGISVSYDGIWVATSGEFINLSSSTGKEIGRFQNWYTYYADAIQSNGNRLILINSYGEIRTIIKGSYTYESSGYLGGYYSYSCNDMAFDGEYGWVQLADYGILVKVDLFQDFLNYPYPYSGTLQAGESVNISTYYSLYNLSPGLFYQDELVILSNSLENPSVSIPVRAKINGSSFLTVSKTQISSNVYLGYPTKDTLELTNTGTEPLEISQIENTNQAVTLGFNSITIEPYSKRELILTFDPTSVGTLYDTLTIHSNDTQNPVKYVFLELTSRHTPKVSIAEMKFAISLFEEQVDSLPITVTNSGEGPLEYYIQNDLNMHENKGSVVTSSRAYSDGPVLTSKDQPAIEWKGRHSFEPVKSSLSAISNPSDLEDVLQNLSMRYEEVTSIIPNVYNFRDGFTGTSINDGGNDMYDGGNYLFTDLNSGIPYTNNTVVGYSPYFNNSYFTAKYNGLFVLSANLTEIDLLGISGNLGADGGGSVDGSVLSYTINGTQYLGFVKRVYGTDSPSVNHLVIVKNNGIVTHDFSTYTNDDYHLVSGLTGVSRIYYLLFAGSNGHYVPNESMLEIMHAFLDISGEGPVLKIIPPDSTVTDYVTFDAIGKDLGLVKFNTLFKSNDQESPLIKIPTEITVKAAPALTADLDSINFGQIFVGQSDVRFLNITNTGSVPLILTDVDSDMDRVFIHYPDTIQPDSSNVIYVIFEPSSIQTYSGNISISSNDPRFATWQIPIKGEGVASTILSIFNNLIKDTLSIGSEKEYSFIVANKGTNPLTYRASITEGSDFSSLIADIESIRESSGFYSGSLTYPAHTDLEGNYIPVAKVNSAEEIADYRISTGHKNVLILASDDYGAIYNVLNELTESDQFGFISFINTSYSSSLTLEALKSYDAVLVWSNYSQHDGHTLGNVLADYVDAGGGVVTTIFENTNATLGGRWSQDFERYMLYKTTNLSYVYDYNNSYLIKTLPDHPLLFEVDTLNGGYYGSKTSATLQDISDAASVVATWNNLSPLIVVSDIDSIKRVDLGFYPVSSNYSYGGWSAATDGMQIIINALNYVGAGISGSEVDWISAESYSAADQAAGTSSEFAFKVDASDLPEGENNAKVTFYSNDSRTQPIVGLVNIFTKGEPELVIPDSLDLQKVTVGFAKTIEFQVRNLGNGAESLALSIDSLSDFSISSHDTVGIAPYGHRSFSVTYTPSKVGNTVDTLWVNYPDTQESEKVLVYGEAVPPGIMRLEPDSINLQVEYQGKQNSEFIIHNDGSGDLNFVLEAFHLTSILSNKGRNTTKPIPFNLLPVKGSPDTRKGHEVIYGFGEDEFGYTFIDSHEENGPQFTWNDIRESGTALSLEDDEISQEIQLPFEFPFYGLRKTSVYISSNGLIGFNEIGLRNPINAQIPASSAPNGLIAPFWKDLAPQNGGTISYQLTNEHIIIQFTEVPDFENSGSYTFQVILYKSGDIQFYYQSMSGITTDATVGIEHEFGNSGLQIAFNTQYISDQMAIHLAHPSYQIDPAITKGKIAAGDSLKIPFTYFALDDLGGLYSKSIGIISNDTVNSYQTVDLSIFINGSTRISAYSDTISFDTTYVNRISQEGMWFRNDSVGILKIEKLTSSVEDFKILFPEYEGSYNDSIVKYSLSYNSTTGRLFSVISGLQDELLAAKLYGVSGDKKLEIVNLDFIKDDEDNYHIYQLAEFDDLDLWLLSEGKVFMDLFTSKRLKGFATVNLQPVNEEVLPYEYSSMFNVLFKPSSDSIHITDIKVNSNAINSEQYVVKAFGKGLQSDAKINVSISELVETLNVNDSTETNFTISNIGIDTLYVSLSIENYQFQSSLNPIELSTTNRTQFEHAESHSNTEINSSTEEWRAPVSTSNSSSESLMGETTAVSLNGSTFTGIVYGSSYDYFSSVGVSNPGTIEEHFPYNGSFCMASEFLYGSTSQLLILDIYGSISLVDLEKETTTYLGYASGDSNWTGMTTDPITQEIYFSTRNGLYTFNLEELSVTLIGYYNHSRMTGIAMNRNRKLYGYSLNDVLVEIDPTTGESTYLGPLGFDAEYGQDMAFNSMDNRIYLAAFNAIDLTAELRVLNLESKTTEFLGLIGNGDYQMAGIAFPITTGFYLSTDVTDSLLLPGQSIEITTSLNAKELNNGKHSAHISIESNDYSNPLIQIPVDLHVTGNLPQVGEYTTSVNFGLVTVMDTVTKSIKLSNIGKEVLLLTLESKLKGYRSGFEIGDTLKIDIGSTRNIPISFTPTSEGIYEYNMIWRSNDPLTPRVLINLSGASERASQELELSFFDQKITLLRNQEKEVILTLRSLGEDSVKIQLAGEQTTTWMEADSLISQIAPDSTLTYIIRVSSGNLPIGTYQSGISLVSNDPLYTNTTLPIGLTIINGPIERTQTLQDGLIAINEPEFTSLLSSYFSDADGDSLIYSVSVKTNNVSAILDNATLRISGERYGADTLSLVSYDQQGDTLITELYFMANTRPMLVFELQDFSSTADDTFIEIMDLDNHFKDADQNILTYSITNSNPEIGHLVLDLKNLLLIRPSQAGSATVIVTADDGYHSRTDTFNISIDAPLGTASPEMGIRIYPNPTHDILFIEELTRKIADLNIEIFDLSGRIVHQVQLLNLMTVRTIDLSGIPSGVYVLNISSNGKNMAPIKILKR